MKELPDWALCCDAVRQLHLDHVSQIVQVQTDHAFLARIECQYCHRVQRNVRYFMTIPENLNQAIAIDLFDFDEGTE